MELRHLKYFLVLAEELNFTKAAEKLFISQPPLSRQIKELENEIGARLFDRNNKKVVLTDAGKYFESEIRDLITSLERITHQTKRIADNVSGDFRIGYISSTFSSSISQLIQYLSNLYPLVNFKLYEIPTIKQIIALEQGKLDLGILRAPIKSHHIKTKFWFKDYYALVYNRNVMEIESDKDIKNLSQSNFIFFNQNYAPHYYSSLLEICANYGFTPNVTHESNNVNSIIQLIRNGLGVSILPVSISKNYNYPEMVFFELKNIRKFTEVLIAVAENNDSIICQASLNFLVNNSF